jgi:hypothetical protein
MKNPFVYGKRVSGKSFFDRTKVKADIRNVLNGGSNVLLYGPRRYGKSSLVGEVLSDIRAEGGICAELNMMDIASLEDFIVKFARIVYRELSPVSGALNLIAGFLRNLSPAIGIDEDGKPELRISFSSRRATIENLREVLELPERLCGKNRSIVIAIDEFQEVAELGLGAQFERTMRSVVERQEHVSYLFLGSKTHILERMFALKSRPFYNSAQKFLLQRPPAEESAEFLVERFSSVSMKLDRPLAEQMVRKVDNVPYYLQALGSWTFNVVYQHGGKKVRVADVDAAFESLYDAERILLEDTFKAHPETQRLLMRALAVEPINRFDEDYRVRHGLKSTSTVNTALRRLVADSTIEKSDAVYVLANPLLAYYLKMKA